MHPGEEKKDGRMVFFENMQSFIWANVPGTASHFSLPVFHLGQCSKYCLPFRSPCFSTGAMFQVLPLISGSLFFDRGNVPSTAFHFSLLVFRPGQCSKYCLPFQSPCFSSRAMFQVLPSISVSLFFVQGNVPSTASHFSLPVFQDTHAERLPRDSNLPAHGAGLCQLLPHAGLHDLQRLALSCHYPWRRTGLFLLWLEESHGR